MKQKKKKKKKKKMKQKKKKKMKQKKKKKKKMKQKKKKSQQDRLSNSSKTHPTHALVFQRFEVGIELGNPLLALRAELLHLLP